MAATGPASATLARPLRESSGARGRAGLFVGAGIGLGLLALVTLAARLELRRVAGDLGKLVDAQATELDRQLGQLALVPRLLADDPRIVAAVAPVASDGATAGERDSGSAARGVANRTLGRARRRGDADFVYLMDGSGETVAASNWAEPLSFVGANYGYRPYFTGAIEGAETSFFAVGATTGEPGYFVARPVRAAANDDSPVRTGPAPGVLVAKFSLGALIDTWRAQSHRSVVTDELGVVILSTDEGLLYAPGAPLDARARSTLAEERRYAVRTNAGLSLPAAGAPDTFARISDVEQLAVSAALAVEPWRLHLLVPRSHARTRAALAGAAAAGVAAIALLLVATFHQQRRIAAAEGRAARELEGLVATRTAALEAAQRALIAESNFAMLGRMSAAINHEINQPLASLRLDLATLRQLTALEAPPFDDIRQTVVDVDRTTRRIGRVVETLRSVARTGSTELVELDALRLVVDAVDTVRRERPDAAAALAVRLPDTSAGTAPTTATVTAAVTVRGNAVLLQQALLNLLHNAFDAVRRGDGVEVLIGLAIGPDSVRIHVDDDGPGVDPALAERLFEPFATGDAERGGLGLGLALAGQIAADHGGSLERAERVGGGSRFTLTLPRRRA